MATPHVSGVAALAWSMAPAATYQTVRDALLAGVDPVASMAGITVTGGRLNAFGTLRRIGMTVRGSNPAAGDIVTTRPVDFVIDFSQPVNASTLDASDLIVNLTPADTVTFVDADTALFHFNSSPVTAEGLQTMHMAAGSVATTSTVPINPLLYEWSGTFRYDVTRMQVVATDPANASVVTLPFTTVRVHLNEPVDPATIGTQDLVLNRGRVTGAVAIDADTVEYTLADVLQEGTLAVVLPAGALADGNGNPMLAYEGRFELDFGTVPLPAPLALREPQGSLVYSATVTGSVREAADTDNFTLDLAAGQTITVVVDPDNGLQPTVEVFAPSGTSLGSVSASAGIDAVLQTLPVASSGVYRLRVSGLNGSTGDYALQVGLNAAVESELHEGAVNDSRAAAQDLDAAFLDLGGVIRAAVLGQADGFEANAAITTSYSRSNLRQRIPSPGSTTSTLTVADSYAIVDLNVRLGITHPDDSDLTATLSGPNGGRILLFAAVGGEDANFTSTTLDDEAATNIRDAAAPFTGTFRPEGRLAAFDGQNVQGNWTLQIDDPWSNDAGKLNSWGIEVIRAPASPDFYAFSLAAGERTTLVLTALTGGVVRLELQDSSGAILATDAGGVANVHAVIDGFTAPSAGVYYAVVTGNPGVDYSLVVLREAGFDLEGNNDFGSAQDVGERQAVLGALIIPAPLFVTPGSGGLSGPVDLAFGPDGSLYVTGFSNGTVGGTGEVVHRYDGVTGDFRDVFVSWHVPYGEGLTFGPDGNLYVADGNAAIQRFDGTTGGFIDQFATRGQFDGPRTPVFGPDGNLYVTNITDDSVTRYNGTTGAFIDEFVPTGRGGLDFPWGMAFGPDSNNDGVPELFVASFRTGNILRYNGATGAFLGVFVSAGSGGLSGPQMIRFGLDATGDAVPELYVAAGDVLRYDGATGAFLDVFVARGDGGLDGASGLTFGPDGSLYVTGNNGVLRFRTPLSDRYRLDLAAGAELNLATVTPLGALNGLDPMIKLYNSSGVLVASDDNSATDGRNAQLSYTRRGQN